MSTFDKIKAFCRPFRIVLGLVLIAIGIYTGITWFYLGIIPLVVGIVNFCPLCLLTKKCELKNKKD
ncbi:YgaP family membrane protein [Arcobacter porcinus]|uniref:Putative membrane protein n=1 Tax=Arcobacter porcinus TaxID=1935204 RepID=A0A1C0B0C4_9BACT|nr:DUF2892 domain-containing protein [Arcobacter porcinus]OCL86486.1 hypothetical protein AAX30_01209 [Arcobacter porcinus]OCL93180.1 hypothetical protein AAX28_00722 [Arcobacter porcinus]OCL96930.1 hypothetical protein AAX27_00564 [Aliarcobacter thereius]QEP40760.1 putative membrane protein [Arcobacter porcinus]